MVSFVVCIDLDRDAPFPVSGIPHAVSMPLQDKTFDELRDPLSALVIDGTWKGLSILIEILEGMDIPAVFFHESRTLVLLKKSYPEIIGQLKAINAQHGLHGRDHEDYSGKLTGVHLSKDDQKKCLTEGKKLVQESLDSEVNIFRAPYMESGEYLFNLLPEAGIFQDSSCYKETTTAIKPEIRNKVIEFPVIKTPRSQSFRGMYTYLWPLFEGTRTFEDVTGNYLKLLANTENQVGKSDGEYYISLNLHPWHLAYYVKEKRYFTEKEMEKRSTDFKQLLQALKRTGEDFTTFQDLI